MILFQVIFWKEPIKPNIPVNLMVAPHDMHTLIDILRSHDIQHQLHIENVQQLIESGQHRDEFTLRKRGQYNFEHYQTYKEVGSMFPFPLFYIQGKNKPTHQIFDS